MFPSRVYDAVVLSFVLHNFDSSGRRRLLARSADALRPGGRVAILDWACPPGRWRARAWASFLRVLEPSPAVLEVADGALLEDLAAVELVTVNHGAASLGRCQILVAGSG